MEPLHERLRRALPDASHTVRQIRIESVRTEHKDRVLLIVQCLSVNGSSAMSEGPRIEAGTAEFHDRHMLEELILSHMKDLLKIDKESDMTITSLIKGNPEPENR